MAGLSYDWIHLTKELTINTQVPIASLHTHTLTAQLGYAADRWRVLATAALELKRGSQYLYGENANNYYHLLLIARNYRRNTVLANVYGDYRLPLPVGDLLMAGEVGYDAFLQHVQETLRLQYCFPLKGRYAWLVGTEARLHQYENARAWQIMIETGLTF